MSIAIVLENTSHPGNIGAAARAMYTMGFDQLILINPCEIIEESYTRARLGRKIIENAQIAESIDCLAPFHQIYGTTCRQRSLHLPVISSRELSGQGLSTQDTHTAILFGNETNGLSNEMLGVCQAIIEIPTYQNSSLNLSHAIQLICYELSGIDTAPYQQDLSPLESRLRFLQQVKKKHEGTGILLPHTLNRLKIILNKSKLTEDELKLLYSFFIQ